MNAVENKLVVAPFWSIFHAAKKSVRSAIAVTALQRALGDAVLLGHLVVTNEGLVSNNNALGVRFA